MIDLSCLDPQQREAVLHRDGPCLVLASAGSGKTRVITCRAAHLVDQGVIPERILLATFTRKAAEEMQARMAVLIGEELAGRVPVRTFHGHCLRMLKISCAEIDQPPFDVLAPGQAIRFARDILAPADAKHLYGMDWKTDPKFVLSRISRTKVDLVDVDGAERWFRENTELDDSVDRLVDFWKRYELAKAEAKPRLLDFDDFLLRFYQLCKSDGRALERWQNAYEYILEDEVQDTNIAQHEIVKLLAAEHRNYFAVGDVNQSCYGFRGSAPEVTTLSFQQTYPDGRIIKLPTNYRSKSTIVDMGARLIRNNELISAYALDPKSFRSDGGPPPAIFVSTDEDSEAEAVARAINELVDQGHYHRDIAVLYRVNAQSRALEDAMVRRDIPYHVWGSSGFYGRREVRHILAYLQLAHNPNCEAGDEALGACINIASSWFRRGVEHIATHFLGKKFVEEVATLAHRRGCSMWQALDAGSWKSWQWESIDDFREIVEVTKRAGPTPTEMIKAAREAAYDDYLAREEGNADDENDGTRAENLDQLVQAAGQYDNAGAFLDFVTQQQSRAKQLAKNADAIQLSTLHRAKGLEWPVVWLCGVSLGLLPHKRSVEYFDDQRRRIVPESIQEERRLCYVGITRARDELRISALLRYQGDALEASPFLGEMGFEVPPQFGQFAQAGGKCDAANSL